MNYEAERAMNQKRLRMEGEPGHGIVQGNGLPLNYIDNGHQIPYQPYAGAYNTHYPPPDAFAAYGPPPPGGYAPQNLSYAPPAHQNYPHHQSFPTQQAQAQLHMQSHMGKLFQGYGDVGVHKPAWPPQPHLLPPLDTHKPLDVKQLKPEIKLEPTDIHKRPHPENEMMGGELEQPKIKIKTDIFKPDDLAQRPIIVEKPLDVAQKPLDSHKPPEHLPRDDVQTCENKPSDSTGVPESCKPDGVKEGSVDCQRPSEASVAVDKSREEDRKPFSPDAPAPGIKSPGGTLEPKKRGRPKGSTNKPKPPGAPGPRAAAPRPPAPRPPPPRPVPRAAPYHYAVRPYRKDFSGIQFRRRWSDDCLDSSHIPNEVYFGDVPVSMEVLFNYYDANAERERLATQAAHIAAQKAAAAKLAAAKQRPLMSAEVTTVDSSSSEESSGSSGSESEDSDEEGGTPLKRGPGRPKGSKNSSSPKSSTPGSGRRGRPPVPPELRQPGITDMKRFCKAAGIRFDYKKLVEDVGPKARKNSSSPKSSAVGSGRRGRPPVPPELRQPGITDMKRFCKAAGIRFDYKKLVEGCTKNKERVQKMMDLLTAAGLEGKPTLDKCKAIKQAKLDKKEQEKLAKKEARAKHKDKDATETEGKDGESAPRRMTRGATGVKPRQRIVISSDEEDDTPAARRTLSKLRCSVNSDSDE